MINISILSPLLYWSGFFISLLFFSWRCRTRFCPDSRDYPHGIRGSLDLGHGYQRLPYLLLQLRCYWATKIGSTLSRRLLWRTIRPCVCLYFRQGRSRSASLWRCDCLVLGDFPVGHMAHCHFLWPYMAPGIPSSANRVYSVVHTDHASLPLEYMEVALV